MNEISIKTGKEIIIDYLTVTFEFRAFDDDKELEVVEEYVNGIRELLNVSEERVFEKEFGKGNYRYAYQIGDGVTLKLCGPINECGIRTCSLELKGEGCREYERNNPTKTWKDFVVELKAFFDVRASRVDVSFDDFDGDVITFDHILSKLRRELYTSSYKKPYVLTGNDYEGWSITFGRRKANSKTSQQLVIYEKNKEQKSKGIECNQPYWTRYEMRFLHEKAAHVFNDIFHVYHGRIRYPKDEKIADGEEGFKELASRLLYGMLDIKEDSTYDQSNMSKVPTDPKWLAFVGSVKKAKIPGPKAKESLFSRYSKYYHQTSSIYILLLYLLSNKNIKQFNKEMLNELKYSVTHIRDSKNELKKLNSYLIEKNKKGIDKNNLDEMIEEIDRLIFDEEVPF